MHGTAETDIGIGLRFAACTAGTCSSVLYMWLSRHWDSALPSATDCVVLKLWPGCRTLQEPAMGL